MSLFLSNMKITELKQQVLLDGVGVLSNDLGNPKRYFPKLRSAGLLDQFDCETILNEVTTRDKVLKLVDIITKGRQGKDGRPAFDVFVEALLSDGVHTSVARRLQRDLEMAKKEETEIAELESGDSSDEESTPIHASPDGASESETHQARARGTHTPLLQLGVIEGDFTTIVPQPHNQLGGLHYYPMTNKRHGVALIVNNKQFHKHSERKGSDRDEANLVQTWLYLGYRVEVRRNCTSNQITKDFRDIDRFLEASDKTAGDMEQQVTNDSFVCCFLSHGRKDEIISADSKSIKMEDLERMIGISKKLRNKPKLFFIQACRGSNVGAEIQSDDDKKHCVTNRSDMYFSYATVPGDRAYRDTIRGSWFVTELCKTLCECATSCTLHEMQHHVNAAVPGSKVPPPPAAGAQETTEYAQQPANAGTMTKCVHFFDMNTAQESY